MLSGYRQGGWTDQTEGRGERERLLRDAACGQIWVMGPMLHSHYPPGRRTRARRRLVAAGPPSRMLS